MRVSNLLTGSLHDKSVRSQVQNDVADNVETQTETSSVTRGNGYLMDNLALRYSPTDLDRIYVYGGVENEITAKRRPTAMTARIS